MAHETAYTLNQQEVDAIIEVALRYKKLPSEKWNFDASISEGASKSIRDRTQSGWYVYAAANAQVKSSNKFEGKVECRRLLDRLESSNIDAFVALLDQQIQCRCPEEKQRILKLSSLAATKRKKRRIGYDSEDQGTPDNDDCNEVDIDDNGSTAEMPTRRNEGSDTQTNNEMQWRIFSDASLDSTVSLFPQFLADAVERKFLNTEEVVAAVDIHTPSRPELYSLGCIMVIHVIGSAIFRLARDLFDVCVEQDTIGMYIAYPGGAKLRPQASLKLEGGRIDAISTFFGEQTCQAIRSSNSFRGDLCRRHSKTMAVTMTIDTLPQGQGTSGRLFLSLGIVDAGTICSQLYI